MPTALTFTRTSPLPVSAADAFAWHERPGAFERLCPPWERIDVIARKGGIEDGAWLMLEHWIGPCWLTMEAEHFGFVANREFNDRLVRGPFARWEHCHRFTNTPENTGSVLSDGIVHALPGGAAGNALGGKIVGKKLSRLFAYRHAVTAADLSLWKRWAHRPRLRVLVTGSTGLVGRALCALLTTQGHEVLRLVRGVPVAPDEVVLGRLGEAGRIDAVVHLAGENIAGGRWTAARRRRILESRVEGTRALVAALGALPERPSVLIGSSAVGYYGDRGEVRCAEGEPAGRGFLSEVCRVWEHETRAAEVLGVRTVQLRTGVVLTPAGGALKKLLPVFRAGLGGRLGDGRMWMSWISIDDLVGVIAQALVDETLSGPVNAVAPHPVTNNVVLTFSEEQQADYFRIFGEETKKRNIFVYVYMDKDGP
ncbi:MAG: TIGR01777 family oxidoreductase, partial [Verrucomicrobiota bacterium]